MSVRRSEIESVDALLASCTDKTPPPDVCLRVRREILEEQARGYGPQHPVIKALRAKLALCSG